MSVFVYYYVSEKTEVSLLLSGKTLDNLSYIRANQLKGFKV